jgi:hypothetical protein
MAGAELPARSFYTLDKTFDPEEGEFLLWQFSPVHVIMAVIVVVGEC